MNQPLFIAIEGGEGAGKSTLLNALKIEFGDSALFTREPGGSPYAEVIRELALTHPLAKGANTETMLCLMFAARFDHVENAVLPALRRGDHVITDRFDASSYAYQLYAQEHQKLEELFWKLRSYITREPDLYVYVDVDVEEGLRRVKARNLDSGKGNHFDDRPVDFHQRLRKGYVAFLKKVPHVVINANQSREKMIEDFLKVFRNRQRSF